MTDQKKKINAMKPLSLLDSMCRGLSGYMTYQASCGMSQAYSEYFLYDPICRIAKDKGWSVQAQFPMPKLENYSKGKRSIDFDCLHIKNDSNYKCRIAIEVKWMPSKSYRQLNIDSDIKKLIEYMERKIGDKAYLLVAGARNKINSMKIKKIFKDSLPVNSLPNSWSIKIVNKCFCKTTKTNYGAIAFEILKTR